MTALKRKLKIDGWLEHSSKRFMPQWMKTLYICVLTRKIKINQIRVFIGQYGIPYLYIEQGTEKFHYTIQELIDTIQEKLQENDT